MTYRPKAQSNAASFFAGASSIISVALFYASSRVAAFNAFYQIAAIILAITALQVFLKYVQSDYVYKSVDSGLEIYKITGNKSQCVCSLNFKESISGIVKNDYAQAHESNYPKTKISLNFCKTLFPKDYYLYYFNFNGKSAELKFEPDEMFANHLNDKIKGIMSEKEKEENENNAKD